MYHPTLHLELARELARDRVRQVAPPPTSTSARSTRPIRRLLAPRTRHSRRSRARWA
jgi:hypothetical protein